MRAAAPHHTLGIWKVVAALAVFLLVRHARALTAPFFSDDYIFFDKLAGAPFGDVWGARDLAYHWYRPWSRELHYWTFYRFFGLSPLPYHIAGFALWLGAMALYWTLAARIAGRAIATLACCGVSTLAAWSVLLEWSPGVQDLWMLVFALASLIAYASRRTAWAVAALAMALLSKENSAVLPAIAFAYSLAIERQRARDALRRVAPMVVLVIAWALVHPSLGGQLWWAHGLAKLPAIRTSPFESAWRSVLALFNLDVALRPVAGWWTALLRAAPGALVLAALAAVALRRRGAARTTASFESPAQLPGIAPATTLGAMAATPSEAPQPVSAPATDSAPGPADERGARGASAGRVIAFGILWMLAGLVPLCAPSVLWQPYYVLYAALGAWLAIAVVLSRAPAVAVAALLAVGLLSGARSDTPSRDWGNEVLQRFGKRFMAQTEDYLKERFPSMPRNARLYFTSVPRGVVFVTGTNDAPALRVWFRDPSVMGSFWTDYRPRGPKESVGPDYFFRYDSLRGWFEVIKGPEGADSLKHRDPDWKSAHERLAYVFAQAGDLAGARSEFEKLAVAYQQDPEYAYLAGVAYEASGDSIGAGPWYVRAALLPGADGEMKARAARLGGSP